MMKLTYATAVMAVALTMTSCGGSGTKATATTDAQSAAISDDSVAVDTATSLVTWRGFKPGGEHYGTVCLQSGYVYTTDDQLVGGRFVIDMNSIFCQDLTAETGKTMLEEHLKSKDFFNTAQYPTAEFVITKVAPNATDSTTHTISGNLTLLGQSQNISFGATLNQANGVAEAQTLKFVIDRTKWGVAYKSKSILASLKDGFIEDNIELSITAKTIAK